MTTVQYDIGEARGRVAQEGTDDVVRADYSIPFAIRVGLLKLG